MDNQGDVVTYNGSSWSSPQSIDPGGYLDSVSCPTSGFCAAVDGNGNASTYSGSSWSSPESSDPGGYLTSVSCPSAAFCLATDWDGNAFAYNGSTWSSPVSIDGGGGVVSVSCPTTGFCAAVDHSGNAVTYDGSTWSSPEIADPGGGGLVSVSCPATGSCAAVDQNGNALTYQTPVATRLVFSQQPSGGTTGVAWAQQPQLTVEDADGNPLATDASTVMLVVTPGTPASGGPGSLTGCSGTETSGVVSFSGCKIGTTGTGYKLTATDGSLTAATSSAFDVTVAPAPAPAPATTMAPLAPFPCADLSYPNGAIVSFSRTDYVFAGGHAFAVPSAGALAAVQRVDHATVLEAPAGAAPPTTKALRSGTLVFTSPVDGKPAIYVAGTDGQLHAFATPAQLLADGYDVALVVTVPSISGLRVGPDAAVTGPSATALATSADGAIVASSGTYYVFAGGRAFAVPTPAALTAVQVSDMAKTLIGPVNPAQIGSGIANGTLLSAPGGAYVGYEGSAYPFKAMSQLAEDGYSGTAAVPVPATAGVNVVFPYSGS